MKRYSVKPVKDWKLTIKALSDKRYNAMLGKDSWACWDSSKRTVYLRASRSLEEIAEDFDHELEHVRVDYKLWVKQHRDL